MMAEAIFPFIATSFVHGTCKPPNNILRTIFVEPACGEKDIVVITSVRCMCVCACVLRGSVRIYACISK